MRYLIAVECHRRACSRALPRPSTENGTSIPYSTLIKIEIYSPDSLIVGTRGRDGAIGGLLPGSMSKYPLLPPSLSLANVLMLFQILSPTFPRPRHRGS